MIILTETDIKEIKALIDKKEEGNFIDRYRLRKNKKELKRYLALLDIKEMEVYQAKIRKDIKFCSRIIKKINIDIINNTAKDEEISDEEKKHGFNLGNS